MTTELDNLIASSWLDPVWLDIASEWHDGQWSMLYAVASTGSLTLGSVRPIGDDGPMTDADWYRSLLSDLSRELDLVLRSIDQDGADGRLDSDQYDYHDIVAFRDAVESRISQLDSADPK